VLTPELPGSVSRLVFCGDDRQLAAQFGDRSIAVWDTFSGKRIDSHSVQEYHLEPARGGRVVATTHGDAVRLTDLDTGKPLHAFEGHRRTPCVRFGVEGTDTLLSRGGETALVWDTRSWKVRESLTDPDPSGWWSWFGRGADMDRGMSLEKQLCAR